MVEVWEAPITEERKKWTTDYLEKRLKKEHEGQLTQKAAEALATRDRNLQRMVQSEREAGDEGVGSRVGQKKQNRETVGEVWRPEMGPLRSPQVLWELQAQALTGWNTAVRKLITREVLRRVVLSKKVLESIHRLTDRDRAMSQGVSVEELPGMDLQAITMTPKIAHLVWQNVNKLKGLQGKIIGRKRFWACMHMPMWEGAIYRWECGEAPEGHGLGGHGSRDAQAAEDRQGGHLCARRIPDAEGQHRG